MDVGAYSGVKFQFWGEIFLLWCQHFCAKISDKMLPKIFQTIFASSWGTFVIFSMISSHYNYIFKNIFDVYDIETL